MIDPTWTAIVQAHLDALRSEAEHERLAAMARSAPRGCPVGAGRKLHCDRRGRRESCIDAAVRPSGSTGDRS